MRELLSNVVDSCVICQTLEPKGNSKAIKKPIVANHPRERYQIDCVEYEEDQNGYTYDIRVVDCYDKTSYAERTNTTRFKDFCVSQYSISDSPKDLGMHPPCSREGLGKVRNFQTFAL